jgi:transcriptional regulator with XRE-family HTH domain
MQTIGERLEDARKQKGISIREAAESTKIRGEYLQKFEGNQFDVGLSNIYVRGFLRTYANFLKLPAERLLNDYAALGNEEPRARQPSREVYGRMDLSVSSADGRGDRGAPPAEDTAAEAQRAQAKYSRSRTNLPAAPLLDPALVLKFGKIALVVVGVVAVLWAGKSLLSSDKSAAPAPRNAPAAAAPAVVEPTITLIALDTVRVKVAVVADGRVLFPDATLVRGQTQVVAWPGEIFITASAGENLQIEANGKRFGVGFKGYSRGKLPAPGTF